MLTDANQETKPKYEIIEYEGKPARQYADGSIRNENGQLLKRHPGGNALITTDSARTLARARHEKTQELIRQRVKERISPHATDDNEAFAEIVAKQAAILSNYDKPRLLEVEKLGHLGGWVSQAPASNPGGDVLEEVGGILASIAEIARAQVLLHAPEIRVKDE